MEDLHNILDVSMKINEVIINLLISLICGIIISFFYRTIYNGPSYQASFVNTLIVLIIITSIVIMAIGNNLARALGLVGAMSIIRFRTAVKETQDNVILLFAFNWNGGRGRFTSIGLVRINIHWDNNIFFFQV